MSPPESSSVSPTLLMEEVLVLTFRKGFWASPECEDFPRRLYGRIVYGHSTNWVNTVLIGLRALLALVRWRPKLLLFGSAHRLVPFYIVLRRLGILKVPAVVTNQVYFGPRWARYLDRVIVHSSVETEGRPNYVYHPVPVGSLETVVPHEDPEPYVFSGGGTLRDFGSLVEAVRGTGIRLLIVTHSPETLSFSGELPEECRVLWRLPLERFLSLMAGASIVVVPLLEGDTPRGHTTIAQALALGKAVVTTRGPAIADYVRDGEEGLLVDPGDVAGYRECIRTLLDDDELRRACERQARERAPEFSYGAFADFLRSLCSRIYTEAERRA